MYQDYLLEIFTANILLIEVLLKLCDSLQYCHVIL